MIHIFSDRFLIFVTIVTTQEKSNKIPEFNFAFSIYYQGN